MEDVWLVPRLRLEDMVEDKIELDQVSYNIVLDACGSAGMWQLAWQILRVMWQRKVSANAISFNSAMSASAKEDLWEQGLHLLGDMASSGLRLDAVTCSAALNTSGGSWERVSTLLARSREVELDAIALNAAMGALSSAEQWQDALFLHQEAPELNRQLPNAAVAKGPWLRALAVAAGMDACRMQTDLRGTGALGLIHRERMAVAAGIATSASCASAEYAAQHHRSESSGQRL